MAAEEGWYWRWFPLVRLVWVAAAGGLWYLMPRWGPWAVALALVPWAVHAACTGEVRHRTPFDAALLLFLTTVAASLAATYDPQGVQAVFPAPIGWGKLWGLVLATLVFYALVSLNTERERRWAMGLLSGFGAAIALWFMTTNDWDATPVKWTLIPPLGRLVQSVLPGVPGERLNPNVAGGLVALTLPMGLELAAGPARRAGRGSFLWTPWALVSAALMGLALLLSNSRGAWLGFAGALCLAAAWWLAGRVSGGGRRIAVFLGLVAVGALAGTVVQLASPPLRALTLESDAAANRLRIFSQAALLARDYAFTGCGLGQLPLVHSTYALLIHVPVLIYAHATPLAVAVEQGVPAALTLLAVRMGAGWMGLQVLAHAERAPTGLGAGLLGLAVVMVHGLFDNVIYGTRALLLLWLPVGLIVAACQRRRSGLLPDDGRDREDEETHRLRSGEARRGLWRRRWAIVATVMAALVVGVLFWRPLAAEWQANLGAVHQTLVELRAYDWHHFEDPTLDEVRRRRDLSAAVAHFERALAVDPGQVTARTRLAQIALSRGAYDEGLTHARAAWEAGHQDRVTRLVLGDALLAQGRVDEAVSVVRGLEQAERRWVDQAYYRYWINEDWQRAAYVWQAVLDLDPENAGVRQAVQRAEERVAQEQ
jgi:hypothetical protein